MSPMSDDLPLHARRGADQEVPFDVEKDPSGWPWYEARLSVHVRESKPTDTFGEGGEELAHYRASTQAPSFPVAVERLNFDLATGWERIMANAELVDQEPVAEVLPKPVPWWAAPVVMPFWYVLALAAVLFLLVGVVVFR